MSFWSRTENQFRVTGKNIQSKQINGKGKLGKKKLPVTNSVKAKSDFPQTP